MSARKKLLDTNHPKFKAVTAIKGKIQQYWKSLTLPYPEPGVRLIKHVDLEGRLRAPMVSIARMRVSANEHSL